VSYRLGLSRELLEAGDFSGNGTMYLQSVKRGHSGSAFGNLKPRVGQEQTLSSCSSCQCQEQTLVREPVVGYGKRANQLGPQFVQEQWIFAQFLWKQPLRETWNKDEFKAPTAHLFGRSHEDATVPIRRQLWLKI
jgi:hypothetical protein